jgi:murein DD-endopeptidase MepM/ murein hydrolase activator NlpD
MKENKENGKANNKKKSWWKSEKRFYLLTAVGCAVALVAIIVMAVAVSGDQTVDEGKRPNSSISSSDGGTNNGGNSAEEEKPVDGGKEEMLMPVANVSLSNDYGFWYNKTLDTYYEHTGMDFIAAAGTEVLAVKGGTIESIYKEDLLSGMEIVIDHGNGLKSVYRFVTEAEGLKTGDRVERGQVIGVIAEANGDEYKEGAHLHFEIMQNGKTVDPATHLTLEEK